MASGHIEIRIVIVEEGEINGPLPRTPHDIEERPYQPVNFPPDLGAKEAPQGPLGIEVLEKTATRLSITGEGISKIISVLRPLLIELVGFGLLLYELWKVIQGTILR
jgi:hypothetical protein